MARSDTAQLAWIRETVIGTTPSTPPFGLARVISDSLVPEANTEDSAEINNTPGMTHVSRGGWNTRGSIVMPMAYNDLIDEVFKAVLGKATTPWVEGSAISPAFGKFGFTLEKGYLDSAGTRRYHRFAGATFSGFEIGFNPQRPLSFTADVVGGQVAFDDAMIAGATYANPSPTIENAPPMRAAAVQYAYGGTLSVLDSLAHTALSIRVTRGTEAIPEIGKENAERWELGTLNVEISATVLYGGNEPQEAWQSQEEFSLDVDLFDDVASPSNHTYEFDFNRCIIAQAPVSTPTRGSDVVTELTIRALQPTGGDALNVTRDTA